MHAGAELPLVNFFFFNIIIYMYINFSTFVL